jgi:hypothetical protein
LLRLLLGINTHHGNLGLDLLLAERLPQPFERLLVRWALFEIEQLNLHMLAFYE